MEIRTRLKVVGCATGGRGHHSGRRNTTRGGDSYYYCDQGHTARMEEEGARVRAATEVRREWMTERASKYAGVRLEEDGL